MRRCLFFILAFALSWHVNAQTERWDSLMAQAKNYVQLKEYARAIQCNEELIADLEAHGVADLSATIRDNNAINYLYLAVPLLKAKNYAESKVYLDKALANAKPEGRVAPMVHSWIAQWYSIQSQDIRVNDGDLSEAIALSQNAEMHFAQAHAIDRKCKEQVNRASMLSQVMRTSEAVVLLQSIISECSGNASMDLIRGEALGTWGEIDLSLEDYQSAIIHLDEAYTLCSMGTDKTHALLAARRLLQLYTRHIPDNDKAQLWEQRVSELEPFVQH